MAASARPNQLPELPGTNWAGTSRREPVISRGDTGRRRVVSVVRVLSSRQTVRYGSYPIGHRYYMKSSE